MKNKKGNLYSQVNKVMECWKEHFSTNLNSIFHCEPGALDAPNNVIEEPSISKDEIREAVTSIKHGKATGTDRIKNLKQKL